MPEPARIREQLERILSSADFARAPRHSRFLAFIVAEALEGRGGELKEYVVATTVFDKPASFDPREDSTVRTEASKLRSRIAKYYAGPGAADSIVIELARGGYCPSFAEAAPAEPAVLPEASTPAVDEATAAAPPLPATSPVHQPFSRLLAGVILLAILGAAGAWLLWRRGTLSPPPPPPRLASVSTLLSEGGRKRTLSISPDGQQIAFSWQGSAGGTNWDIWVSSFDSGSKPRRLTWDAAQDWSPSWSPDGRSIAFVRDPYELAQVYVVPAGGGDERKLDGIRAFRLAWAPDGKTLVTLHDVPGRSEATAVFLVDIATGARRQMTFPAPAEVRGHTNFAVSPDGSQVAYVSATIDARQIMVSPLDGSGGGTVVACCSKTFGAVNWEPGGKGLFVSEGEPESRLRWIAVAGGGGTGQQPPQQRTIAIAGMETSNIDHFATAQRGPGIRLAANVTTATYEIWSSGVPPDPRSNHRLVDTEGNAWAPQFSPDGTEIAFLSDRTRSTQIWTARGDGSGATQLTSDLPCEPSSVRWDRSGATRTLVFDCVAQAGGDSGLYTVEAGGGKPVRLVQAPRDAVNPSFSLDGRRIYFSSRKSGRYEVWSLPSAGGSDLLQVTHNGAVQGLESPDGKSLILLKEWKDAELWRLNLADGRQAPMGEYAFRGLWESGDDSVALVGPSGKVVRVRGGKVELLVDAGALNPNRGGFSVHPKSGLVVYGRATRRSEDLVLAQFGR